MMRHLFVPLLLLPWIAAAGACGGEQAPAFPASTAIQGFHSADRRIVLGQVQDGESHWITSWYGQPAWSADAPDVLGDTRPALLCSTPSRFLVTLPSSPGERTLTTAVRRSTPDQHPEIRCEVFWSGANALRSLGFVLLPPGEDRWVELRLQVPSESGDLIFASHLSTPGLAQQEAGTLAWATPVLAPVQDSEQPDVLLLSIDTLRFDALQQMPYLQGLMARGTQWHNAYSPSNWTLPAMASLFTGLPPSEHGCGRGPFAPTATGLTEDRAFRSLQAVPTLAEAMREAGYATAMFHQNPFLEPWSGLQRGFQRYVRTADRPQANHQPALSWWQAQAQQPRFLVLHYMAPHLPNGDAGPLSALEPGQFFSADHSVEDRRAFFDLSPPDREQVRRAYREAVQELDRELSRIIPQLLQQAPDCRILVHADHGEEHWEAGAFEHGFQFNDSVTHVPLAWIEGESSESRIIETMVPAHHLGSFLLESLQIPNRLPPSALGDSPSAERRVESAFPLYRAPTGGRRWNPASGWENLPFLGQGSPGSVATIDPQTAARLAELGYAGD